MSKISFFEKVRILIEVSKNSKLYILLLILLIIFGISLVMTNKKNSKTHKLIYSSVICLTLLYLYIMFHDSLGKMINYMMDNFFIAALFPNIAIYLAALIITNIIVWISIFSYKTSKQIKILNVTIFVIMNYILALLLNIINKESLDVFSQNSIYENKISSSLISLSSVIFITWIIFLIIYKILLIYTRKDYKPKVKKVIVRKKVKKLPENYVPIEEPKYIKTYNGTRKPTYNNAATKEIEKMLTLDDYKLLLKILNEQKHKERKQEQEKPMIINESQDELKKYNELLELYRTN